jgi:hypothetical protein
LVVELVEKKVLMMAEPMVSQLVVKMAGMKVGS